MTKNNLTTRSSIHSSKSWREHSDLSSEEPVTTVGSEGVNVFNAAGGIFVVLACVLASNLYVRRKSPREPRPREAPRGNVRMENGEREEGSTGGIANAQGFSVLIPALRCILQSCGALCWAACHCWKDWTGRQSSDLTSRTEGPAKRETHATDAKSQDKEQRTCRTSLQGETQSALMGVPRHVAVIMDGNRRFGRVQHGDPLKGHSDGGKKLGEFLEWCMQAGVGMATAFAFSTENWKRDSHEVAMLMDLICTSCGDLMEDAVKKNMRIRVLASDTTKLPERVLTTVRKVEHETRHCTGFLFNICLSYGARQEVANACRQVAGEVFSGALRLDMVNEAAIERHLLTKGLPDPDILIRTSGEKRVSNFLLFQMAYTELFFVDKLWPEVTQGDILKIFDLYKKRERRFGC